MVSSFLGEKGGGAIGGGGGSLTSNLEHKCKSNQCTSFVFTLFCEMHNIIWFVEILE